MTTSSSTASSASAASTSKAGQKKPVTKKPNKKHQYGVCTEWNKPSDSHHLILHLRIQPSKRDAAAAAAHAAYLEGGGDAATFKDLLKYRPELSGAPQAYEQMGSDSYPYRFDSPNAEASEALRVHRAGGDPATASSGHTPSPPTFDEATGRRISAAHTTSMGPATEEGSSSVAASSGTAVPGHVHGRVVPVPSTVHQMTDVDRHGATVTDDGLERGGGGACAETAPTAESVHHPVLHCWWCTCAFQWTPYAIPLSRDRATDKYETTGTFCSPECCAAYIFGNNVRCGGCHTHGSDPWKQYEMLHRMVTKMVTKVAVRIKLAPPRETLQKFGGPYTIDEYRRILNDYRVDVRITMPPVNPLNGVTEEIPVDYVQQKKKFVPIDSSRVEKATNELRLKRKKKQAEENTLETFMQLRIS